MKKIIFLLVMITGFFAAPGQMNDTLPEPYATKSVRNNSKVLGWPDDLIPTAPPGFTVTRFADHLNNPRWIYVAGNGDVFVSEPRGGNDIILFRDNDKNGIAESRHVFF